MNTQAKKKRHALQFKPFTPELFELYEGIEGKNPHACFVTMKIDEVECDVEIIVYEDQFDGEEFTTIELHDIAKETYLQWDVAGTSKIIEALKALCEEFDLINLNFTTEELQRKFVLIG